MASDVYQLVKSFNKFSSNKGIIFFTTLYFNIFTSCCSNDLPATFARELAEGEDPPTKANNAPKAAHLYYSIFCVQSQ